ncbi:MAG: IS110 family transposase [Rhizobiales bacterium]|nr:IS110 family transposase [Hyphomicrobiales bacterium]
MHTAELNQSKAPMVANNKACFVKQSHAEMLKTIKHQLHQVKALIVELIEQDQELLDINKILQSFVGIGEISACGLIATLPELGKISRRQISSLVGLAPYPKQSGKRDGYRSVSGGRVQVKKILFMVAMVAVRSNSKIKEFYDRLILNGKKKLVALTAAMRKIITILNAQIRDYYKIKQMS